MCSVALDSALPGVEHLFVVLLLSVDSARVFQLGQFGGALLEHLLLQILAHGSFALSDLAKDVGLMSFTSESCIGLLLFVSSGLTGNFRVDLVLLVVDEPLLFVLDVALEHDVCFTVGVDVLEKVDASLVFAAPLLLSSIPLLGVVSRNKLFYHFLVSSLVRGDITIMRLKLLNLSTAGQSFVFLKLAKSSLALKSLVKHDLVSLLLSLLSKLADLFLLSVVLDQLKVSLTVQEESLLLSFLLSILLVGPLGLEHILLTAELFVLSLSLKVTGLLLPLENCHGVGDFRLLFSLLLSLTLDFLLLIKLPELGVDLLFKHLLLVDSPLVYQLLLSLDSSTVVVELCVLFA